MLFIVSLLVFNARIMITCILQDINTVLLDNANYKVDIVISDDDYEKVKRDESSNLKLEDNSHELNEFDQLAYKQYKEALGTTSNDKYRNLETVDDNANALINSEDTFRTTYRPPLTKHAVSKRNIDINKQLEYDYNDLLNEYYNKAIDEGRSNNTYHTKESDFCNNGIMNVFYEIVGIRNDDCTDGDTNGIGLKAIKCLWIDYKTQRRSPNFVRTRLLRIIKLWFLVYLAVAVPLWCTRGWCCCCLFCKLFKPRKIIAAAKKYVLLNPPGVFKTKNGEVQYDATEREKECYEEFEHFIRTL